MADPDGYVRFEDEAILNNSTDAFSSHSIIECTANEKMSKEEGKFANLDRDSPEKVLKKRKKRVILMTDSIGRDLTDYIQQRTPANVMTFVRFGAKFHNVIEDVDVFTKDFTKRDLVVVIAGTDNVERDGITQLEEDLSNLLKKTEHTSLVVATIPNRFDKLELQPKIDKFNKYIVKRIGTSEYTPKVLLLNNLPKEYFLSKGVNFNKRGKNFMGKKIARIINEHEMYSVLFGEKGDNLDKENCVETDIDPGVSLSKTFTELKVASINLVPPDDKLVSADMVASGSAYSQFSNQITQMVLTPSSI